MNITVYFSRKKILGVLVFLIFGLTIVGCGGVTKKKEPAVEQKASLSRTFKVVDEQGRNAGTLSMDFSGGAVLKDADGKIIGKFKSVESTDTQPAEAQSKPQSTEVKSEPETPEVQQKSEATETQSEQQKPEAKSETETSETKTKAEE